MRACWPFLGRTVLLLLLLPLLPFALGEAVCQRNDTDLPDLKPANVLSRRRRLAFPKGSTFVVTMSVLQAIQLKLPSNWNLDFEFDLIWPIPSQEDLRKKFFIRRPSRLKRRHRRELYANFESALNSRDLPGRQCLLRTVCEAKSFLNPPGVSLIEDAMRLVLSNAEEPGDVDPYDVAFRLGEDCDTAYPCPISILQFLLFSMYSTSESIE